MGLDINNYRAPTPEPLVQEDRQITNKDDSLEVFISFLEQYIPGVTEYIEVLVVFILFFDLEFYSIFEKYFNLKVN